MSISGLEIEYQGKVKIMRSKVNNNAFSFVRFKCLFRILKKMRHVLTKKVIDTSRLVILIAKTLELSIPKSDNIASFIM
jgi:hypothetical protein